MVLVTSGSGWKVVPTSLLGRPLARRLKVPTTRGLRVLVPRVGFWN
jgi:hypothetical protein